MSLLLSEAAKTAKGKHRLYKEGERCLWGEACSLIGVEDGRMNGAGSFPTEHPSAGAKHFHVWGSGFWDDGYHDLALEQATAGSSRRTVGDFRKFLRAVYWLQ